VSRRNLVVIGASAGGVEALRALVAGLPRDFPAAVLVVLHLPAESPSALPKILRRAGSLSVAQADENSRLRDGEILVAPPDRHLIVYDHHVTLSRGPRENGARPAVDVLFRSAARAKGAKTIGVVLSGALDDGAAGLVAITLRGGVGVVQDPDDALHPSMPRNAIEAAHPEHVLPVEKIPALLTQLVQQDFESDEDEPSELMEMETAMADLDPNSLIDPDRPGVPAGFSCPDCSGTLFQIHEGDLMRFRCRVGHAWSPQSLLAEQSVSMEGALWMALRSLEEKAALSRDMSTRAAERGHDRTAQRFSDDAREAVHAANLVRELLARAASGSISLAEERRPLSG
jgi:two-component system, chemotaxis family, protein-glutamate methylesterase/glutaminase